MTDLDKLLADVKVPEVRTSLKADILKAAQDQRRVENAVHITKRPANDNKWIWIGSLAACCLFVAITTTAFLQTPAQDTIDTEHWAEAAEIIGYGDLYDWVNEADTAGESDIQYN